MDDEDEFAHLLQLMLVKQQGLGCWHPPLIHYQVSWVPCIQCQHIYWSPFLSLTVSLMLFLSGLH